MSIRSLPLLGLALVVPAFGADAPAPASQPKVARTILYSLPQLEPFGLKIGALPDSTGDGVPDFLAGSNSLDPLFGDAAVRSGSDGAKAYDVVPPGSTEQYPTRLVEAGDVDRDGVIDVAVGTSGASFDQRRGALRVYSGADGHLLWSVLGTANNAQLGGSVAGVGDVDSDGAADVAAGAPKSGGGAGRVFVYSGASGAELRTIAAPAGARDFGQNLARLRDADGDRRDDLLIGAPAFDSATTRSAYVYSLATGHLVSSANGGPLSNGFGSNLGEVEDFDGDGRGDYWVADSSYGGTPQAGGPGRFQVFSGANGALLMQVDGTQPTEQLGTSGDSADFDLDGYSDVVFGAFDTGAQSVGRLQVHAGPAGQLRRTINGDIADERFGSSSRALGDLDGNGTRELLAATFGAAAPKLYVVDSGIAQGAALVAPGAWHSGLWYEPAHDGEGFVLEMLGNGQALVYFFTYTGSGAQRYFVGLGQVNGRRIVFPDLLVTAGGGFGGDFDPADVQRIDQSRLVLSFDGCDSGWAEYTIDGVAARQRLTRLTGIPGLACGSATEVVRRDWSGSWYDAAHSGEGWIVQAIDATRYVVLWFSYNDDGTQQWFIALAQQQGQGIEDPLTVRPIGGRFGRYFLPTEVTRPVWGRLTLAFASCSTAQVSWNGGGRSGTTAVVRLTALQALRCE